MPLSAYARQWRDNVDHANIGELDTPEQLRLQILEISPKLTSPQDIDKYLPQDCKIPPEQQAERQHLSEQMRDKVAAYLLATPIQSPLVALFDRWKQSISNYYLSHKQPEKIKEFETLFAQPESDEIQLERLTQQGKTPEQAEQALTQQKQLLAQQRGNFLCELIEPFQNMSKEDFQNLSEQQVIEQFDDLVMIDTFAMEIKSALQRYEDQIFVPDDKKQHLLKWNDLMYDTNAPMIKAEFMINPCYPLIDYKAMINTQGTALAGLQQQTLNSNPALYCYANDGLIHYTHQLQHQKDDLQQQLKEQGAAEQHNQWLILDKNGTKSDFLDLFSGSNQPPFYVMSEDKVWSINLTDGPNGKLPVIDPMQNIQECKRQIADRNLYNIKQQLRMQGAQEQAHAWKVVGASGNPATIDAMMGAEDKTFYVESNDKTWEITLETKNDIERPVLTSPDTLRDRFRQDYDTQTKQLKNALEGAELWMRGSKEYKDIKKNLETLTQFGQLDREPKLSQCAQLRQHLLSLQESSEKYLATKGDTGKNEREQKRMDAAKQVKEFASRKLQQLSLWTTGLEAKQAQRNQSAPKASAFEQSTSRRRVQQENIGRALDAQRADPNVIREKAQALCNLSLPVKEADLIRPDIQMLFEKGLENTVRCTQSPASKLEGGELLWAKQAMTTMTAMALIEQQIENRKPTDPPIQPGQKLFDCTPAELLRSVQANPIFEQATKDLSPQRFGNFIAGDGAKKLSQQMMTAAMQQKKQAKIPSQSAQQSKTLDQLLKQPSSPQRKL